MSSNNASAIFYDSNDVPGGPTASQAFASAVLGPIMMGFIIQLVLTGIAIGQFNVYLNSSHHARDPKRTRYTVYTTVLLCIVNAALSIASLYHYSIWQIRDSNTFQTQTDVDAMSCLFVGLEGSIVQVYLANRAAKLFKRKINKIIFFLIAGLAIGTSMTGAIYYTIISWLSILGPEPENVSFHFKFLTALWLAGQAFVDVLITICLVFQLSKRVKGFSSSTDSTIKKLIKITLASASYTSLMALIATILDLVIPVDSIYFNLAITFFLPLPALYAIALLANLNSRNKLQTRPGDESGIKGFNTHRNHGILSNSGMEGAVSIELPLRSPITSTNTNNLNDYHNGNNTFNNFYQPGYDSEKGGNIPYTMSTHVEIDV